MTLTNKAIHVDLNVATPWLKFASHEIGQSEVAGAKSNPRIKDYRKIANIPLEGDDSVVPWCAVFVNAMLAKAGVKGSASGLARSFTHSEHFEKLSQPCVGCITVISSNRGAGSGHVFFYTAENGLFFQGSGGNQDDSVSIKMFQKAKLVGHYWPKGQDHPKYPFDRPFKLARPLLPHERKAVKDV